MTIVPPLPPAPPPPTPDQEFKLALRLGWALAEARGRYRLWSNPRLAPAAGLPSRSGHALPLADERTTTEQRVAAEHLLNALADELKLDPDYVTLPGQPKEPVGVASSARLRQLAGDLVTAHEANDPAEIAKAWNALAEFCYGWDTHIQDQLAAH